MVLNTGRAGEGGGHELKDLDRDKEANVVAAAVAALGAVAMALPWPAFSQLLGRFLRLLAAHGEERKVGQLVKVSFIPTQQSRRRCCRGPPSHSCWGASAAAAGSRRAESGMFFTNVREKLRNERFIRQLGGAATAGLVAAAGGSWRRR